MRRLSALLVGSAAALLAACAPPAANDGRALFQRECSSCHGLQGDGAGRMAVFVSTGVPNLRTLSLRNGGTFPTAHVVTSITRISALHRDIVAMPDFGDLLQSEPATYTAPDGEIIATNRAVLDITAYLDSIQER